jgi:predicted nucleic acid-binding protein
VTEVLCDTSVLVKWFDIRGEDEVPAARALRAAHGDGRLTVRLLDLGFYELGNVLLRRRRWPADAIAAQLEELTEVIGDPLPASASWIRDAATLGERHDLSFYDACWAAVARHLGIALVSADGRLLAAGLAESPTAVASRLGLLA